MSYETILAGLHERLASIVGVAATLTLDPAGDDNALLWTSVELDYACNGISVEYRDPGEADATLALTLSGREIVISLATNGAGAISTTAGEIAAAVALDADVSALVTCANVAPDDGSGVVTAVSRTYLTGGISEIVDILDYAPTAIHDTPLMWSLLDNLEIIRSGQVKARRYRILHRLAVRWTDNEMAEEQILPFVDSVPEAVEADPHLGSRLTSGYAEINECEAQWMDVAGVEYRILDFYSTVIDKS
jgi:hypothetical protein